LTASTATAKDRSHLRRYFVITGALSLGYGSILALLADLRDSYGFSGAQLGAIAASGFFAGFVAQVSLARQADRGHTALMVRGGLVIAAGAMLGCAIATEFWMFLLARLCLGLGSGCAGPAIRRLVIMRASGEVGANLGRAASWDVSGFVLGPLVAAVLAQAFNLRAPFVALAGVLLVVLSTTVTLDLDAAPAPGRTGGKGLLRQRAMQSALAASVAFYTTIGAFDAVWSVLLRDRGAETWLIGLTLALFGAPIIFLAPLAGRFAQRRGPLRMVVTSVGIATACTFAYGTVKVLWVLVVIALVHAVTDAFTMPGNQVAVALTTPPHQLAAGQGLLGAAGLVTAGAVGLASGWIYENAGPFTLFTAASAWMVVCIGAALMLGRDLLRPGELSELPPAIDIEMSIGLPGSAEEIASIRAKSAAATASAAREVDIPDCGYRVSDRAEETGVTTCEARQTSDHHRHEGRGAGVAAGAFDGQLPRPTSNLDAAKADLAVVGYAIVTGALNSDEVREARHALATEIAREESIDPRAVHRWECDALDPDDTNRRLKRLPDRHPLFRSVLEQPVVLELTRHILGPTLFNESYLLHSHDANVTRPGGLAQALHRDRTVKFQGDPGTPLQSRFILCLDPFDAENGATRVVPGSHKWRDADLSGATRYESVPAEAPAGSLIVYTDMLLHGTGANLSADRERASLNFGFCPPWCRPTVNYPLALDPDVMQTASRTVRQLLGYSSTMIGLEEPWDGASEQLRSLCVPPAMEW
jgi:ectoine hydroxylase-related dioxygenase (phytanoyl-CoA dioxygenase family)/MFS family permease